MPFRITAFPVRRRRGRRPGAAACMWGGGGRVEALEPRFLLAAGAGGLVRPLDPAGVVSFAEREPVAAPGPQAADDADVPLSLIDYRVSQDGDAAVATEPVANSVPEQKGSHGTLADAQALPGDSATDVRGNLSADGPPALFRVPLAVDRSPTLVIGLTWDAPDAAVAGCLRVLDGAGDLLLEEAFSSGPLEVDLDFDPADNGPGAAVVIALVPAPGASATADFTLSLRPGASWAAPTKPLTSLATVDFTDSVGAPSASIVPSTPTPALPSTGAAAIAGDSLSPASVPTPTPTPTPAPTPAAPDRGSLALPVEAPAPLPTGRVVLPLRQAPTPPAAGIFLTPLTLNPTARQVIAVVADPTFLDLDPATFGVSAVPSGHAEGPTASPTGAQAIVEPGPSWPGPLATPEGETATCPTPDAARPRLVLGLPPVGVSGLERPGRSSARGRGESAGATLPRLCDEPLVVDRVDPPPVLAATEPPPARRPRAALAVLYGSICSVLGVTAPEWAHALRRTTRGAHDDVSPGDA